MRRLSAEGLGTRLKVIIQPLPEKALMKKTFEFTYNDFACQYKLCVIEVF